MDSNRLQSPRAVHFFWLANALFVLTLYGSLIPLQYQAMPLDQALDQFRAIPLHDLSETYGRADWVLNMAQYASVSFCYMTALCVDRRWFFRGLAAAVVAPVGCAAAVGTEFLQVFFPPRNVSLNDILVESLGTVLGCSACLLAGHTVVAWLRRLWGQQELDGLATQALPGYFAVLLVLELMPFDVVFGREELAQKFREGRILLVPFADIRSDPLPALLAQLTMLVLFIPLGVLLALIPRWSTRSWPATLGLGVVVTLLIELMQLVIYTRYCKTTDLLTGTGAILLGWWLVAGLRDPRAAERLRLVGRMARWGPVPWLTLALGWGFVLILVNWAPYHFTTDPVQFLLSDPELSDENTSIFGLRRMSWAPFVDYYWGSRYQALDQIVRRSVSFAPVGIAFALAFRRRKRLGLALAMLLALVLAIAIEVGQYFIPERHPGVTDVLIELLGAWLGYLLTLHVLRAFEHASDSYGESRYYYGTRSTGRQPGMRAPELDWLAQLQDLATNLADQATKGLRSRLNPFLHWLAQQPDWVRVAVICGAAMALSLGVIYLLGQMGVF